MTKPAITRINISRLYNLGNYEHMRYELTVDVPEGQSAAKAIVGTEKLLAALSPKRPAGTPTRTELERGAARLERLKTMTDEEFKQEHPPYSFKGTRKQLTARYERDYRKGVRAREAWQKRKARARQLLDDLGGAARYKDAKDDWDDSY